MTVTHRRHPSQILRWISSHRSGNLSTISGELLLHRSYVASRRVDLHWLDTESGILRTCKAWREVGARQIQLPGTYRQRGYFVLSFVTVPPSSAPAGAAIADSNSEIVEPNITVTYMGPLVTPEPV